MKKVKKNLLEDYLKRYEEDYYYILNIEDYEHKKALLLNNNKVNLAELNIWLKNNVPFDPYTKFTYRNKTKDDLFYDSMFSNTLYIKIPYFNQYIKDKVVNLIGQREDRYLILDLRNNFGGSVEAAVSIADCLVDQKTICSLKYRKRTILFHGEKNIIPYDKILILTNKYTMSSAELLTYSLILSNDNAYMIGKDTYRKNIGQTSLYDKRTNIIFSFSAFEWRINEKSVEQLYEEAIIKKKIIEIDEGSDYNDYMKKAYFEINKNNKLTI